MLPCVMVLLVPLPVPVERRVLTTVQPPILAHRTDFDADAAFRLYPYFVMINATEIYLYLL